MIKTILSNLIYPSPYILIGFMFMILLDLLSGIRKAKHHGIATTSRGLRNTIDKATTYCTFILAVLVIINISNMASAGDKFAGVFDFSINGLLIGCVYIELKSIIENLIAINTKDGIENDLCRLVLHPVHRMIMFNLSKRKINEPE